MPTEIRKPGIEGGRDGNAVPSSHLPVYSFLILVCSLAIILTACQNPQVYAYDPTPIPTLIPATMVPVGIESTELPPPVIESFPAGIPSAANGQVLYAETCAECHGANGQGQVPNARNFGDVDYIRGETPLDFYVAITEGVSNIQDSEYEMPAYGDELSSDERWDLVYFVWRFSTIQQRLEAGEDIYTSFCEECHGADGRSQILDAADLSDQRFMAQQSPSDLYLPITRGEGSMPAWQARLSQDERWMVIEYLRTFSYDPQLPEQEAVAAEPEETEEELESAACDASYLSQSNPFEWQDEQAIANGETTYARECAECHGEDGSGEIPQANDFTNPAIRAGFIENPGEKLCRVAVGLNRMPSFEDILTDAEIWEVLTYIYSLGE